MNGNIMNICGIDCYEKDGVAYLRLETAARGLDIMKTDRKGDVEYKRVNKQALQKWLFAFGILDSENDDLPEFIPENIFYRLAMKAKNDTAEKFQALIADKVIPEIRRTGGYGTKRGLPNMENLRALASIIRAVDIPLAAQKSASETRARQAQLLMDAYGLPRVPDYVKVDPWKSEQLSLEAAPPVVTIQGNRIEIGMNRK